MKIVEYEIVGEVAVRDYIRKGWQPFHGPLQTAEDGICQAMVKYEDDEPSKIYHYIDDNGEKYSGPRPKPNPTGTF